MSSNAPKEAPVDTCDQCRARKVKCIIVNDEAGPTSPSGNDGQEKTTCQSCKRRDEPCTYDYRYKKSGRPKGSYAKRPSTATKSPSPKRQRLNSDTTGFNFPPNPSSQHAISPLFNTAPSHGTPQSAYDNYGPTFGSIFGSARLALDPPPTLSFNYNLPYDTQSPFPQGQASSSNIHIDPSSLNIAGGSSSAGQVGQDWPPVQPSPRDTGPTLSTDPHVPFPQIVTFATWEAVGFFLSLHMRHQHVLTPLVHQPSFARDLLHRRDVQDEPFRGLLLSIVAYTICQVPIHTLLDQMTRPELESLCRRCHRGSRTIQIRQQMRPNKITLASTVFDWISSQAIGRDALRDALMSDIRRLIYALGLHLPNPPGTPSSIDLEIGRRLFWEAYACDKTNALNGHQVNFPDFEGTPPLPLEVDDEYITAESILTQPKSRQSFMSGFIAISRVFQILSQAIMRQRTLQMNHKAGPDRNTLLDWIGETTEELRDIMEKLPPLLRHDYGGANDGEIHSIYATQQANIHITALCLELYLLEFKAAIAQEEDLVINRKAIAEKAFKQLSTIPIDCIASNGESMRGKVLRVILALLDEDNSQQFSSELWDWWNMYSRVQFLQVIPEGVNDATAPQSPHA